MVDANNGNFTLLLGKTIGRTAEDSKSFFTIKNWENSMFLFSVCRFFSWSHFLVYIYCIYRQEHLKSFSKGGFLQNCLYLFYKINVLDTDWANRQERIFIFLKKKKNLKSSKWWRSKMGLGLTRRNSDFSGPSGWHL